MNLSSTKQRLSFLSTHFHTDDSMLTQSSFNTSDNNIRKKLCSTKCDCCPKSSFVHKQHSLKQRIHKQHSMRVNTPCPLDDSFCLQNRSSEESDRKFKTGLCKNFEQTGDCQFGLSVG